MNIAFFNGRYLPKDEIRVSPDDRGFLFADGVYEVVRWYPGFFYDMEGHIARLKRSLHEVRIVWPEADDFGTIALDLVEKNGLADGHALVYLQVTRGAAPRAHAFPNPPIPPTTYAFARALKPDPATVEKGLTAIMKKEPRWNRCDIKSVSLLPNILNFQEAVETGAHECIFVRDGLMTECAHSNIFFVKNDLLLTHPESDFILSGITRKNVLRIAREAGMKVSETAVPESELGDMTETFMTNTSYEVAPIISINDVPVGKGKPGEMTMRLRKLFAADLAKQSASISKAGK